MTKDFKMAMVKDLMRVFVCLVTQSCLTLWDPLACSLPASSIRGTFGARILEWVLLPCIQTCPHIREHPVYQSQLEYVL